DPGQQRRNAAAHRAGADHRCLANVVGHVYQNLSRSINVLSAESIVFCAFHHPTRDPSQLMNWPVSASVTLSMTCIRPGMVSSRVSRARGPPISVWIKPGCTAITVTPAARKSPARQRVIMFSAVLLAG